VRAVQPLLLQQAPPLLQPHRWRLQALVACGRHDALHDGWQQVEGQQVGLAIGPWHAGQRQQRVIAAGAGRVLLQQLMGAPPHLPV
jgi:hypothetical protein